MSESMRGWGGNTLVLVFRSCWLCVPFCMLMMFKKSSSLRLLREFSAISKLLQAFSLHFLSISLWNASSRWSSMASTRAFTSSIMILSIPLGFSSSDILISISSRGCRVVLDTKEAIKETISEMELIFTSWIKQKLLGECALFTLGQSWYNIR